MQDEYEQRIRELGMEIKLANGDIALITENGRMAEIINFCEGEFSYSDNRFTNLATDKAELMVAEINAKFKTLIIKEGRALRQAEKDRIINDIAERVRHGH
jgi:hypothetical protein